MAIFRDSLQRRARLVPRLPVRLMLMLLLLPVLVACGEQPSSTGVQSAADDTGPPATTSDTPPETLPALPGDEVQTGKIYKSGETLKLSVFGVAFKLPQGVAAVLGADAAAMQFEITGKPCLGLIAMKRDIDRAELLKQMKEDQHIEAVVLKLRGDVTEKDGVTYATHADANFEAHSALIIGPENNGVLFFLGGRKADSAAFKSIVDALAAGTVIGAPLEAKSEQQWRELLRGHKLTYMSSNFSRDIGGGSTGHSNTVEISLHPDGRYDFVSSSDFNINTGGGGVAGTDGAREKGTWKIELMGNLHLLTLQSEKGGTRQWSLAWRDEKLFLDGTRYFRTRLE